MPSLAFGLLLLVLNARGADPGDCPKPVSIRGLKSISPEGGISYFMRGAGGTREVSFASGNGRSSRILNLDTGAVTPVDGSIDPVLSYDGKLLAIPQTPIYDAKTKAYETYRDDQMPPPFDYYLDGGKLRRPDNSLADVTLAEAKRRGTRIRLDSTMVFYSRTSGGQPRVSFVDESVTGNYQSLGTLRTSDGETHYRMLYEGDDGMRLRELKMNQATGAIEAVGLNRLACRPNLLGSLPILSHDGREFSYYDFVAGDTKIMSIDDHGDCKVVDTIPALVGKTDFSPDRKRLVFHVDPAVDASTLQFSRPGDQKLALYMYDRTTKALGLLKQATDANLYYPTFISNDEIAYIRARGQGKDMRMSVEVARLGETSGTSCRECDQTPRLRFAGAMIGFMYAKYCGFAVPNLGTATTSLSRLSPTVCRKVIAGADQTRIDAIRARLAGNASWDSVALALKESPDDPVVKRLKPRGPPPALTKLDLDEICGRLSVETIPGPAATSSH